MARTCDLPPVLDMAPGLVLPNRLSSTLLVLDTTRYDDFESRSGACTQVGEGGGHAFRHAPQRRARDRIPGPEMGKGDGHLHLPHPRVGGSAGQGVPPRPPSGPTKAAIPKPRSRTNRVAGDASASTGYQRIPPGTPALYTEATRAPQSPVASRITRAGRRYPVTSRDVRGSLERARSEHPKAIFPQRGPYAGTYHAAALDGPAHGRGRVYG